MGCFVVHHQEKGLARRTLLHELERQIRDDVGRVLAGIGLLACCRVEQRILIRSLSGQDLPFVEAGGIASEVPLPHHPGVVAALLEQPRNRHAGTVEAIEHRHTIEVRVLSRQDGRPARRADRVRGKDVRQQRTFAGDAVEIRRLVDARAIGPNGVRRVVVGHDEDDVGPVRAWRLSQHRRGHEADGEEDGCRQGFHLFS